MYKEYRFPTPDKAIKKRQEIQKVYGYKPEIYAMKTPDQKVWFSIVHPVGLIPANKKDKVFDF